MSPEARERDFAFNIVITPDTFTYLRPFTRSLLAESDVRFRLVANGCPAREVRALEAFASAEPRVTTLVLPNATMLTHGETLDAIYERCDDGDHFCFVDSDVMAKARFMPDFVAALSQFAVVTSCNPAWTDDVVLPAGARELVGRHATGSDGFVYGSSFLAVYRRAAVARVRERFGVSFLGYAHTQLPARARDRLVEMGRSFELYDTAKALNILLQSEGFAVRYADTPALVHIGGISQYLSDPSTRAMPPSRAGAPRSDAPVPSFAASGAGRERWDFARWAAATLAGLVDGRDVPDLPEPLRDDPRAVAVQRDLVMLVGRFGDTAEPATS